MNIKIEEISPVVGIVSLLVVARAPDYLQRKYRCIPVVLLIDDDDDDDDDEKCGDLVSRLEVIFFLVVD